MRFKSWILCSAAIGLCAVAGTAAYAQDPSIPAQDQTAAQTTTSNSDAGSDVTADAGDQGGIETVTVTARQYAESIQTAPVSVTAFNSDQIAQLFVHNLGDLNHMSPNFTINGIGAIHRNAAQIFSRGIGYGGVDMGQDPAVGLSVNGVYAPSNIGMMDTLGDVKDVEILRGPQGTLYGKNTIGGVVNITTKLPGQTFDVEAVGRVGNFNRADFFLAADIPLTDTLAVRISFQRQDSTGPFHNASAAAFPAAGKHLGGDNINTIRGVVSWKPTTDFESDLMVAYAKDRSPSVGGQNGSIPLAHAYTPRGNPALGTYFDFLGAFFGYPGWDFRTPGAPYPAGVIQPYTAHRNYPSGDFQDTTFITWNNTYRTDWFNITAVTGYVRDGNLSLSDYDQTELNFFQSNFRLDNRQISQEIRLESNDSDSPLHWVAGAIYIDKNWHGTQLFISSFPTLNNYVDFVHQSDESYAVFGQADYNITKELQATFGIRYTDESKDVTRTNSHLSTAVVPCSPAAQATPQLDPTTYNPGMACQFHFQKSWGNATYHAGLNYQISDDKMVYAGWSTGFVAGGFNTRVDSSYLTGLAYSPESATAWEIGLKTDWYDHHLRVNAAAFLNKYSNMQIGAFIPGGGLQQAIVNNAFERAQGLELEVTALPIDNLTLSGNVGLLDANYTSFNANVMGAGANNYAFLRPADAPKWNGNFSATYAIDLGGYGTLSPSANVELEDKHFTEITNNPVGFQSAFAKVDASLTWDDQSGKYEVALWGKNLNNAVTRLAAVPSSGYFTQLYFANPMTYGLDVRAKW
jgi:iron complex outermembrane receptor protein